MKYDIATELRLHRAKEADAQAAALQTALEIRAATGNGKAVEELRKTNPELFAELSHSDDEKASLQTVAADSGSYIADPDIMNRPKMSRISPATKQAVDKFFNDRERLTGKAADKSYAGMGKPSLQQTLMNMRPAANATDNRILRHLANSRSH